MAAVRSKVTEFRFIKFWLPAIIYAIFIFSISSLPASDIPCVFAYQDAVFHILEYAGFALLLSRAVKEYFPSLGLWGRFFAVAGGAVLFALSDEFHQSFVAGRNASGIDIAFDGIGVLIGYIVYR